MKALITIARNQRQLEHEAFYHGSQGCPPEEAVAEIDNKFNQQKEIVSQKATPIIKQLEAVIADTQSRLPSAQGRFTAIVERHAGRLPEIVVPSFMLMIGIFAMLAEAEMLSPFMDLFGIANPTGQRLAAFAIGCACANILHLTIESLSPGRFERHKQTLLRVLGVFCVIGLIWAGIARGRQAAYGATLNGSPLAGFIVNNSLLAMIVYTFFTVAFPVAGAVAINFGTKAAREWREYLLAKRDVVQLTAIAAKAPKDLESEEKKLRHELNTLESVKQEWQKSYLVQHQRGIAIGAAQGPKWMIWVKAAFVALVALLLSLPAMRMPLVPIVITITAYVGAWIYFYRAWAHPKPHQLYDQQNVDFRAPKRLGGGR